MPSDARAATGRDAETIVADELEARGFEIIGRNVRVGRLEIDLIAKRGKLLVICEVRSRRSKAYGSPALTIDRQKIAKVRRAAATWLKNNRPGTSELRFDAAAVTFSKDGSHELTYYERAF